MYVLFFDEISRQAAVLRLLDMTFVHGHLVTHSRPTIHHRRVRIDEHPAVFILVEYFASEYYISVYVSAFSGIFFSLDSVRRGAWGPSWPPPEGNPRGGMVQSLGLKKRFIVQGGSRGVGVKERGGWVIGVVVVI